MTQTKLPMPLCLGPGVQAREAGPPGLHFTGHSMGGIGQGATWHASCKPGLQCLKESLSWCEGEGTHCPSLFCRPE